MPALTDFFLKRDAKEKVFISRKMNAGVRESEKTEIYDEIDWTKLIREMGPGLEIATDTVAFAT